MSGAVIGGVVGAVIGYFIPGVGPQMGWMIGSAIGAVAMPPEMEGPRLNDLTPQGSQYGRPIPIVKGTTVVQGNVIWQTDLEAVEDESGGKGGGGVTTHTYYANFAVLLCEGPVELGRIWAGPEKRLIWDGTTLEGGSMTFYNGSTTQNPNPLMESHEGVGNVPAYRGWAYLVFEDFPVANDGGMIPFLTVEVGDVSGSSIDLGNSWPVGEVFVDSASGTYSVPYSGAYHGVVTRNLSNNTFVSNYQWAGYRGSSHSFYDPDRNVIVFIDGGSVTVFDVDTGSTIGSWSTSGTWPLPGGPGSPGYTPRGGVYHNGLYCFLMDSATDGVAISTVDPASLLGVNFYTGDVGVGANALQVGGVGHRQDGDAYILGATAAGTVRKYPLSAAFTSTTCGACVTSANGLAVDPNTGYFWTVRLSGGSMTVACNDPVTGTQKYSETFVTDANDLAGGAVRGWPFLFNGDDGRVVVTGAKWLALDFFIEFESGKNATPYHIGDHIGTYHGTGAINSGFYNPLSGGQYWIVRDYMWANRSKGDNVLSTMALWGNDGTTYGVYLGSRTLAAGGQTLQSVVTEFCERADLTASDLDVTSLNATVDGYGINQQTTVRGVIQALQPAFYFDVVESNGKIKFVSRGGASVVTIPDGELGAHYSGSNPDNDLISIRRQMEDELPSTLSIRYVNRNSDYENLVRYARRLVGASGDEQNVDLSIVMTDTKAQEVAETNLHKAWVGRKTFQFSLPLKYTYLEPTDVITVKGQTVLLTKVTQDGGLLRCEGVFDDFNYTPNVVVTETPTTGKAVFVPSPTVLELM